MDSNKHCYLIMAHNEFNLLERLICFLDDERNDIYVHIDRKVKQFDFTYFRDIPKYSRIVFVKQHNVQWAAFSQIETEMELFKVAIAGRYSRFHLISGVDIPIKSLDYIYQYSEEKKDTQFVDTVSEEFLQKYPRNERFQYYHFFEELDVRKRGIGRVDKICLKLQEKYHVDRWKHKFEYGFGSQWVSLTEEAVRFLIENERWIRKTFRYSHCADELFMQTVLLKGNFRFEDNKRFIKWPKDDSSPHPKILGMEDLDELKNSEAFFARKVMSSYSKELINYVYNEID